MIYVSFCRRPSPTFCAKVHEELPGSYAQDLPGHRYLLPRNNTCIPGSRRHKTFLYRGPSKTRSIFHKATQQTKRSKKNRTQPTKYKSTMLQCAIAHIWSDLRFHDVLHKCASLVGENMGDFAQGVDDLTRMDLGLATFDRRTRILFHELPLNVSFQKSSKTSPTFAEDQEGLWPTNNIKQFLIV